VNPYEILLMLEAELADDRQSELVARVRELVEKGGGTWVSHDPWGRRRLAYEIDHKSEGAYHLVFFDSTPETLDEISRVLKITDGVVRFLAVRRVDTRRRAREDSADRQPEYAEANVSSPEEEE
jgi:small subunit ribosomal protein S6